MITKSKQTNRILVVDDNEDAATSLAFLLKNAGYVVATAFDGNSALELAERFHPALCILDINMPGMNGYDLARRIRALTPEDPPVLATVTAYDDCKHLDRAVDAGFDLHFTKTADLDDMFEQLAACLDER